MSGRSDSGVPPSAPALHRFSHEAMTTTFDVFVAGGLPDYARQASQAVFGVIDRLEGLLSRYASGSDISRVNHLRPGESIAIAAEVCECLALAAWTHARTDGLFDISVGPVLDWSRQPPAARTPAALETARRRVGLGHLVLDPAAGRAGLHAGAPPGGLTLDLGGIGKGFALDRAADLLEDWDIRDYLLVAGGSTVLAAGRGTAAEGWDVGVGGPWGVAAGIASRRLRNEALSGSGTEVKGAHIVEPQSGQPATAHLAAWAVCPSATLADALSTAFMLMPTKRVAAFCAAQPEIAAYVVEPDGRLLTYGKGSPHGC